MSIFSHLMQQARPPSSIRFMYTTRVEGDPIEASRILFLQRIMALVSEAKTCYARLELFVTGASSQQLANARGLPPDVKGDRIRHADLDAVLGTDMKIRDKTVCYVCGPPRMTDEIVDYLRSCDGMDRQKVLCEKWW